MNRRNLFRSCLDQYEKESLNLAATCSRHISFALVLLTNQSLAESSDDIDDPSAIYLVSMTQAMVWPYDEHARVISERVYRGSDRSIRKCDPSEVISMQECREKLIPTLPPVHDPRTGKPRH